MTPSDFAALTTASIESFKILGNLVKGVLDVHERVRLDSALIEIQQNLLQQQAAHMDVISRYHTVAMEKDTLQKELLDAKEQLAKARQFKADADRYRLVRVCPGLTVYALKESAANGDPPHWLCPQCLGSGVKSFVQASSPDGFPIDEPGDIELKCLNCGMCVPVTRSVFEASWRYA